MCCISFARSSVDGHLGYDLFVYNVARNVYVQVSVHIPTFNSLSCLHQSRTVEPHGIVGLSF